MRSWSDFAFGYHPGLALYHPASHSEHVPSFTHPPLPHLGPVLPRPADDLPIGMLGRVTLITGPAGYGKSLLVSQWEQKYEGLVAWFNPVRLYQPEEVLPGCLSAVRLAFGNLDPVVPGEWQRPEVVAEQIRREVAGTDAPLVLVLDGTQFIGGDPTLLQEGFRIMVERLPENMSIISTSRNIPMAGAEVARMLGRLDLIDQESLAIPDSVAMEAFLRKGAAPAYAAELTELCEGWPAAISLVLAMPELPSDIATLRSSAADQGILRFLSEALIDRIKPDLREVLIQTSVADVVTSDLALSLGVPADQTGALETAIIQGIPATRVAEGKGISLHPLFRDQLLQRLRRRDPLAEKMLRRKYAELLLEHDDWRGIDQLILLGDLARVEEIIETGSAQFTGAGLGAKLSEWTKAVLSQKSERALQLRGEIYVAIVENDLVRADSLLDSMEEFIDQTPDVLPRERMVYFGNRCWTALNAGDLETMREMATQSLAFDYSADIRFEEFVDRARSYLARYRIHAFHAGETDPEVARFLSAKNEGVVSWQDVTLPGYRAQIAAYRGEINRATSLGKLSLDNTPANLIGSIFFPWFALLGYAGGLRESGNATEAIKVIEKYYDDLLRLHPIPYVIDIMTVYAGALADLGQRSKATEVYEKLRELVERYGRGWWAYDRLDFQEARFLLRHGETSRAIQLASRLRDTEMLPSLTLQLDVFEAPKRALKTLESMTRQSPVQEINFRLFSALLTREHPEQADLHLKHLLSLMEEHGAMRVVVDRGREAVELVSIYVSRYPTRFGENLVTKMNDALALATPSGMLSPLSKREQQILGMLATSMTLKQIADSLFVSQNTLKTHLRHLYRKMQVRGREQAVEQGKKLLLLP